MLQSQWQSSDQSKGLPGISLHAWDCIKISLEKLFGLCLQTDPEAAKIVFECGAPIVMLPVELTHTALVTPDILNRISAELADDTPFLHLIKQLLLFFADSYRTVFKFDHPPLHDPCAVAYVIAPELFKVCFTILPPACPHRLGAIKEGHSNIAAKD